jgi:hypothetical protein
VLAVSVRAQSILLIAPAAGALFARVSVNDARALHRRLSLSLADDPIATRFSRLVVERRARLMVFLADARRREAVQLGRSGGARG